MKLKIEICVAMSKNYFQLTLVQRYQIEALKDADHTQRSIAKIIGVDRSTICRELKRIAESTPPKEEKISHSIVCLINL